MTNREKTRRLLVELGFTADEIRVAEELAAKQELSVKKVIRNGLRLSQANYSGLLEWKREPIGCPFVD